MLRTTFSLGLQKGKYHDHGWAPDPKLHSLFPWKPFLLTSADASLVFKQMPSFWYSALKWLCWKLIASIVITQGHYIGIFHVMYVLSLVPSDKQELKYVKDGGVLAHLKKLSWYAVHVQHIQYMYCIPYISAETALSHEMQSSRRNPKL